MDVDLLESADQGAVLFEIVAVLLVGGRAQAAQGAALERWLEQIGGIERAAAGRAGADHGVDLVDEQDRAIVGLELGEHALQALFEIAAVTGAGEQRAHVELVDHRVAQDLRHFASDDAQGQTFGDRGLADARVAHEKGIVLGAPAQDLDGAFDLQIPADQDVDLSLFCLLVEIGAVGRQGFATLRSAPIVRFLGAAHASLFAHARALRDAVADVVDGIEAGHVLLLQEEYGMGLPLREQSYEDVGAGHFAAPGALDMDGRALDDPLETGGGLRVDHAVDRQAGQLVIQEIVQAGAQPVDLDRARLEHGGGVIVIGQRHQQVL